ncbi:MAG: APC family permease [Solirubrobacteraceae bacterium]
MATAVVEERQLLKTLRWWDGFAICLANPGFLLGSLGFTLDIFGVIGSIVLWGASSVIALLQAWIYSEPATMFPGRTGGIALYANEGWRKYTTFVGPVSTFGYWIGWSVVLSIFGKLIGDLVTYRWFPTAGTWFNIGSVQFGLSHAIAIATIVTVWLFNVFGIKPFKWLTYVTGGLLMIPLLLFIIVPYFSGDWHSVNVHASFPGPWGGVKLAVVYMFILAWSAYGTEAAATFSPEYRDTVGETRKAFVSAATFSLLIFTLLPLGLGGLSGAPSAATAEGQYYVDAFRTIAGGAGASIFLICLIASLLLSMSTSTGDAGRALYGISRSGLTIKQFGRLNRFHVPGNAMTLDLFVNICLVLFISSNLAILYMSNIGYVLCHVFALSGLLLLRKDRPNWPRPIKLAAPWLVVAAGLCLLNAFFLIVGALAPNLNGYGNWTDFGIGVGILFGSILLFLFRKLVQDREPVHFREETPAMPEDELRPATATAVPVG